MVRPRRFRGDQHENEVHGSAILRLEVDGALKPGENPEDFLHLGDLAMRNGDAVANACGFVIRAREAMGAAPSSELWNFLSPLNSPEASRLG